ncbi:MAG: PAS domain S-box protein, partial [Planctomycetia bacterium]|nr:PAS domain S-box protein [Planctomycetia bacterium]
MKISRKISLSFLLTALVLAGIGLFISYFAAKESLERAIDRHLTTTAQSRARHIETYLKEEKETLEIIAQSLTLEDAMAAVAHNKPDSAQLIEKVRLELLEIIETESCMYEAFVLTPAGKIITSTDAEKVGLDRSADAYFLRGKEGVFVKDAYYSETTEKPSLSISAPIKVDETGEFLGVVVARHELTGLNSITTDRTGLGETGEIYLINKDGYMITPSRFAEDTFLKLKVDTENARHSFLPEDESTVHGSDIHVFPNYEGTAVLGAHTRIEGMGWRLLAEIGEKEALAPLARLKLLYGGIAVLAPLAAWLIGFLVSRVISGPIERLHRGTEIIGKGNLDYKVATDADDETGQLSRAFDTMMVNLKATMASRDELRGEISERKRAEEALRQSEGKYRSLITNIPDVTWTTDCRGKTIFISPNVERVYGYKPEEICAEGERLWFGRIHPDDVEKVKETFKALFEKGTGFSVEYRIKRKDGRWIWLQDRSITTYEKDGAAYADGVFFDITERKRAEEKVRQVAEQWSATFDSITDLVSIQDKDFKLVRVNKAYAELFNMRPEELIGKTCCEMVHGTKEPLENCPHRQTLATGKPAVEEHFEPHLGIYLEVSTSPLFDEHGEIAGTVHIAKDITERKRAEEALRKSEEAERQFREQLTTLNEVTSELSMEQSLDALCRRAVELGRERLGFDRLGIRFVVEESGTVVGSFGVNESGGLRDERSVLRSVADKSPHWQILSNETHSVIYTDTDLFNDKGEVIGHGTRAIAALWDGEKVVGCITADNLLLGQPITEQQFELLTIYASALGHLCTQKRAEEALRQSEEKFRSIVDNIGIGISLISSNMEILSLNRQMQEWFPDIDVSKKPICYGAFNDPPREGICSYCPTSKTLEDGQVHESVTETPAGDELRNYRIISTPIKNESGEIVAAIEMVDDITERKQAEEALIESEARYRALFEASADGIIIADSETKKFKFANPAVCRILGYSEKELKGMGVEDIHPKESLEHVISEFEAQAKGEKILAEDIPCLKKDGTIVFADINATTAVIEGRKCSVGFFRDITERKQAEERVRKLSMAVEQSPNMVMITDTEGVIEYVNPRFTGVTGYSLEEVVGRNADELGEQTPEQQEQMWKAISTGNRWQGEFQNRKQSGDIYYESATISPLRDPQGAVTHFVKVAEDITEQIETKEERERLTEENLRLQRELKGRFQPANIVGTSGAMQAVYDMIAQVSASITTVLIGGESGTG